jgi:hypothetical protein
MGRWWWLNGFLWADHEMPGCMVVCDAGRVIRWLEEGRPSRRLLGGGW